MYPLLAVALSALLQYAPPMLVATPDGLLVAGGNGEIPLPPEQFRWETLGGQSHLIATQCGNTLTLRWKMDRRGPSFVNLEVEQKPGAVNVMGWIETPERPGEAVIECEHYESWADLMRHRHEAWLANDLMVLLRRSGVEVGG